MMSIFKLRFASRIQSTWIYAFEGRRAQVNLLQNYCKVIQTIRRTVRVLGEAGEREREHPSYWLNE